jgi:ligand-binding sensor domain-containing protein
LTPDEIKTLTDLERPQFYEDSKNNLWIGLHGSGLALYNRDENHFDFFRNDPKNPNSISSNIVHCIAEDKTRQLWLGTGQVLGGIEKVILRNPAFEHYLLETEQIDILDNVARVIIEDKNKCLWVGSKAGKLHLFDSTLKQVNDFISLPGIGNSSLRNITYSMFEDRDGYLWVGTKGYGLSVSTEPLGKFSGGYNNLRFRRYEYSENDSTTIGNNNIYSICQDKQGGIWIGTYGNGLSLIMNPKEKELKFVRINQMNSNLSSNLIRHLLIDSSGNLWAATTFGLNYLAKENIEKGIYRFKTFLRNPSDDKSLSYNDIIHIFEDTRGKLWFGTFGGGVDLLERFDGENPVFKHYNSESGPGYGIIFGILEDVNGFIWLSSENGLTCLNPENADAEIYNSFNGLGFNSFSENTCFKRSDGSLIFGGYLGFEVVRPEKLASNHSGTHIELTKFLLFNKEVSIDQKASPLKKSISFSQLVQLKYFQSSFSLDF